MLHSDKPLVSVVIPVYNAESVLERCLNSLYDQTLRDFEIIAVDDGSSDNSWDILQRESQRAPVLRIQRKHNGGASTARNLGQDFASGGYITFVDADDKVAPDFLQVLVATLERYSADIAIANKLIQKRGVPKPRPRPLKDSFIDNRTRFSGASLMSHVAPHAKLFRRDFLERHRIRFFEGITYEDHVHWIECLTRGPLVGTSAQNVYTYIRNPSSISSEERRLEPYNISSRITALRESARRSDESGIRGLTAKLYRSQFNHSVLRHVLAISNAQDMTQAHGAHEMLRQGLAPYHNEIGASTTGWRRLLYEIVLNGDTSDLAKFCRFVSGKEALRVRLDRGRSASVLYLSRTGLPSLPSATDEDLFNVSDVLEKKAV